MLSGCYFDVQRAEHWLEFADNFGTLTEGAWKGKPFRLLDWQAFDTSLAFGWVKHSEEWGYPVRRFRMWYEEVPKKNGKTPLLALIGLYLLYADSVGWDGLMRQISIYLAATTRKQAEKCLNHAVRMVKTNETLRSETKITKFEGFNRIEYGDSLWEVVAADPASADGVNGHCLAEEFHRWKGFEFYNTLKWMLATQPEGMFIAITTAGEEGENVCKFTRDLANEINAGRIVDETFLGRIYGASKDDNLDDEATWFKANPSLGTTPDAPLKLSTFRQDYKAAKSDPQQWPSFARLRLGVWITSTHGWADSAFPRGMDEWDSGPTARSRAKGRIDCYSDYDDTFLESIEAKSVTLALDLASVRDTVAAALSVEDHAGLVWTRLWFWLPEEEADRQKNNIGYRRWSQDGHIRLMPGEVIDYNALKRDILGIIDRFRVPSFYYDPLFQGEGLTQALEAESASERIEFPQTIMAYGPCVSGLERLIQSKRIRHNGNPMLTWQLGNAIARTNENDHKRFVKKSRGERKKVDGAQALAMSLVNSINGNKQTENDPEDDVFLI
jgi:phage terminase large subunit-like protein